MMLWPYCHCAGSRISSHKEFDPARPCCAIRSQAFAHNKVKAAVSGGRLPSARTLLCVDCGEPANGYDHRDYRKPLAVEPVCRRHNALRGPAVSA